MSDGPAFALASLAGFILGLIFFGGLWKTIQWGLQSSRPALLFFSSLLIRMGVVFGGLYWLGKDDWKRLVAALFGLLIARFVVTQMTGKRAGTREGGCDAAES